MYSSKKEIDPEVMRNMQEQQRRVQQYFRGFGYPVNAARKAINETVKLDGNEKTISDEMKRTRQMLVQAFRGMLKQPDLYVRADYSRLRTRIHELARCETEVLGKSPLLGKFEDAVVRTCRETEGKTPQRWQRPSFNRDFGTFQRHLRG